MNPVLSTRRAGAAGILLALLVCIPLVGLGHAAEPSGAAEPLADSVVLARVKDRTIRVQDLVGAYFNVYPPDRPATDSAGRVAFLNSMVNKEVMALVALEVNRPLELEDRAVLRAHTQRVLSNVLYRRYVLDSVSVSEDEVKRAYERHKWEVHLQHILVEDRAKAEKLRRDLLQRRTTWSTAVRLHSRAAGDPGPDGDLGWTPGSGLDPGLATQVENMKPGEVSTVVADRDGYRIVRFLGRRPVKVSSFENLGPILRGQIHGRKVSVRVTKFQEAMLARIGAVFDTTNLVWASARFRPPVQVSEAGTIQLFPEVPHFEPVDTSRVLVRWPRGQLHLAEFLRSYAESNPGLRRSLTTWRRMRAEAGSVILEPYQAEIAEQIGLAQHPWVLVQVDRKREELMVGHLYRDSIESRVFVEPAERRRYYQEHLAGFITYPRIQYAHFVSPRREGADSIAARLKAGESAEQVIVADSLSGRRRRGRVFERQQNQEGAAYHKELFEEMRPGQVRVEGPDEDGRYNVLQLISFDPGRQLSYEEAEPYVIQSVENLAAERLLKAFLERQRRRFPIEIHPERLTRVLFRDPWS